MKDLTRLLLLLNELGTTTRRGPFHCLTITADGKCRAVWTQHSEEFWVAELERELELGKAENLTPK